MTNYDDILLMPHHVSNTHPQMPRVDRAAQFSPFAALTGYGAAIAETGRLTDKKVVLDEYEMDALNEKLMQLQTRLRARPTVTLTYFRPDERKDGGAYVTVTGVMKKIDAHIGVTILEDGTKIPIENIIDLSLT